MPDGYSRTGPQQATKNIIPFIQVKRSTLIYALSAFSVMALILFATNAFIKGYLLLSILLYTVPILGALNVIYLFISKNDMIAGHILSALGLSFGLALIASGAVENTGPLWTYPILAVAMFIHPSKHAGIHSLIFLLASSLLLLIPGTPLLLTEYSHTFSVRVVITLFALSLIFLIVIRIQEHYQQLIVKMNQQFEYLAETDQLTQVKNRHFIYKHYISNQHFSGLVDTKSALILLDIDDFKSINDTYGHDIGDTVLKNVAHTVTENIRAEDIFARWGGEEFLLIFNNTDYEVAIKRAEGIRRAIEDKKIQINELQVAVTASLGMMPISKGQKASEIIKQADEKLYQAKAEGRNKLID